MNDKKCIKKDEYGAWNLEINDCGDHIEFSATRYNEGSSIEIKKSELVVNNSVKNNGGPAFPEIRIRKGIADTTIKAYYQGMSLRDYFAAKAMQGILSSFGNESLPSNKTPKEFKKDISKLSYEWANAMLEARNE